VVLHVVQKKAIPNLSPPLAEPVTANQNLHHAALASTRNENKGDLLKRQGADNVLIDNGTTREQLFSLYPNGVKKVLELIGPAILLESAGMIIHGGIICSTGILDGKGVLNNFDPIKDLPSGVYLTGFFSNFPTQVVIDDIFRLINKNNLSPTISKIFSLEEIGHAHRMMENNNANGKVIVRI
jgi:NADPH:quinone reductase-like Zn-dependent oxidoreductase